MAHGLQQALDQDVFECSMPEFMENLQPHDKLVTPVLRFIRRHAALGIEDEAWYEEQLIFLLERMQRHRAQLLSRADELKHAQRTRRRELLRRIAVATDFLNTNYADDLDLDRVSSVACISKYHFLRLFTCIQGITPMAYLQRKRALVAMRLLQRTSLTAREVAATVGFENGTLLRQIRQWTGLTVQQIRARPGDDLRAAAQETVGLDLQPC